MPHYVVSACLAGKNCRYDGKSSPNDYVHELVASGQAIPLCPEELGGLSTPRTPCEIVNDKIMTKQGVDYTDAFILGAQKALMLAKKEGCRAAILKSRSPSCGRDFVYDGTFSKTLVAGQGVWAKMLLEAGFEIFSEEDLPS